MPVGSARWTREAASMGTKNRDLHRIIRVKVKGSGWSGMRTNRREGNVLEWAAGSGVS